MNSPVLRRRSGHDQQSRGVLPGVPGAGQPVVDAPRDERIAPLDARQQHGQRVPHRLRRRAGHLRRATVQQEPLGGVGREPGRLLSQLRELDGLHDQHPDLHERRTCRYDVISRRVPPHLREQSQLAEGRRTASPSAATTRNYQLWNKGQQIVPELRFDVVTGDPAEAMFNNAANFPGASAASITAARQLYAILTGRVSEVRGIARLNEATVRYEYLGQAIQRARQRQVGLWLADSWRMGPNFTLNYGARYDLTFPFVAENNSYSVGDWEDVFGVSGVGNLFKPGTLTGSYPEFRQLQEGERVLSDGLEQHCAERRHGVDAHRERRVAAPADRRNRRPVGARRVQPVLHAPRPDRFHDRSVQQSRRGVERLPAAVAGQSRRAAAAAPRAGPARTSELPADAASTRCATSSPRTSTRSAPI